jgi:hypothetical protein
MNNLSVDLLNAFKNEADLRDAIRILLGKMPGVRDVQMTHGVQELGKDIVFYAPDFMGNLQLHACVIKNTMGLPPRLRQTVKTHVAVRCKRLDRHDHCTAF